MDFWGLGRSSEEPFEGWHRTEDDGSRTGFYLSQRLDSLLPLDTEWGVVSAIAMPIYLNAAMEMVLRAAQPLALISIGIDVGEEMESIQSAYGEEGASLIVGAVARCLRQETRLHDVVGCAQTPETGTIPTFLIVCPLLDEGQATQLAERLRSAMMAYTADPDCLWLKVSGGVASISLDITNAETLIARCLEALNLARSQEGGGILRYSERLRFQDEADDFESPEDN
jgi:GGDEF domain-containing protein